MRHLRLPSRNGGVCEAWVSRRWKSMTAPAAVPAEVGGRRARHGNGGDGVSCLLDQVGFPAASTPVPVAPVSCRRVR